MANAGERQSPLVLSYLALRQTVGWVALLLPFALVIPWYFVGHGAVESSISSYYYTGMRNLLVGSLCAIGMFNLCCRGYDWQDEAAGIASAIFAIGVAFFPVAPDVGATPFQQHISIAHYTFATLLFVTLAIFCLVLFQKSAGTMTRRKKLRNAWYRVCGWVIVASLVTLGWFKLSGGHDRPGHWGVTFTFETTSLVAFGFAWLIKGETFLKDEGSETNRG